MSKTVLVLDGDSIAYRCSSVGEKRYIQVKHEPTGVEKIFKTRTEFKSYMKEKGKRITDKYSIYDCQEPEPLSVVLSTIKQHITKLQKFCNADSTIIFAGEENNFRLQLDLPSRYKGNRIGSLRPLHLEAAKDYLRAVYKAKKAIGYEVDDACCMSAYEHLKNGNRVFMPLYDKDQCSFTGVTLLKEVGEEENKTYEKIIVPTIGNLTHNKGVVKGYGLKFLAYQWCSGDSTDNFKPYELSPIKFGAKSAYDLLKDLETEKEILEAVVRQFKIFYPEALTYRTWDDREVTKDWKDFMQMYFMCCRMKHHEDDNLDCFKFLKERGVLC